MNGKYWSGVIASIWIRQIWLKIWQTENSLFAQNWDLLYLNVLCKSMWTRLLKCQISKTILFTALKLKRDLYQALWRKSMDWTRLLKCQISKTILFTALKLKWDLYQALWRKYTKFEIIWLATFDSRGPFMSVHKQ